MDAAGLLLNRFDRWVLGEGVVGWVYEYRNPRPLPIPVNISSGLELGMQLDGDWLHRGSRAGEHLFAPGMVHTISPAERYHYTFTSSGKPGLQVGFTLYPAEMAELRQDAGRLAFAPGVDRTDPKLLELCRAMYAASERGEHLAHETLRSELLAFVRRHCELSQRDPAREALHRARQEIEAHLSSALYLEHFAAVAQMHPTRFSRAFAREFDMTPTHFRLECRLNAAVRLGWSRPDLSIRAIAAEVGFDDLAYFHRLFRSKFGLTPAQLARREPVRSQGRQSRKIGR